MTDSSHWELAEAKFGPSIALHGKMVNGTGQMGNHYFLTFTDGSELHFDIEESGNVQPEAPRLRIWVEQP
jgi:hypothetical protein